jgi:hypothetical protein
MSVDAGGQMIDLAVEFKPNGEEFNGTMSSMVGSGTFDKVKVSGSSVTGKLAAGRSRTADQYRYGRQA